MRNFKDTLTKSLTLEPNKQRHVNLAVILNWAMGLVWFFLGVKASLWFAGLCLLGFIVWEVIFWKKGHLQDALTDILVAAAVLIPQTVAAINYSML